MQHNLGFHDDSPLAVVSSDERYRYLLRREWGKGGKTVGFICLNPSTADATNDDPTVRRCINFAKAWGGTQLVIGNLFAYRSTDPSVLGATKDPIGEENDAWLERIADRSDILVAAWGAHGRLYGRDQSVRERFAGQLTALRLTNTGAPGHPLYLPGNLVPFPF